MKVFAVIFSMIGFFLMMAGVGTIEADNTMSGAEVVLWMMVSLIGLLTWVAGVLVCQSQS